nr:unnamed protein product [Digitaria exilis]
MRPKNSALARTDAGQSSAATRPASGSGGADAAKARRRVAFPSTRRRRLAPPRAARRHDAVGAPPRAAERDSAPLRAKGTVGDPHDVASSARCPSSVRIHGGLLAPRRRARSLPRLSTLHRASHSLHSLARTTSEAPRAFPLLLPPRDAQTEPVFIAKFVAPTSPFPNPLRTELVHSPSSISPNFPQHIARSPARIPDFPQIEFSGRRTTSTSSPYFEPSPSFLEHAISFPKLCWCSRTSSPSANDSELAGVEAAAAAPPPPRRRRNPVIPRPPNRPQMIRGEPRIIFPHFPEPSSPWSQGPFFIFFLCPGSSAQKFRTCSRKGAIPDGNYHLIPADEEGVPEPGAGADVTNPEANPQSEQEGKPRSMT